ncbi:Phospholipase A(1) LCAT3 [Acorus gramineus]|uniref:Phospholipase A(1) LCAT3 n=1 Tax=Acorus gramineus TaxID=55184 RepID=A0AAV9B4N3_ACOGR|nr:Phospholipase A(1) LCAT3 [Acorus gramineus]
MLFGDCCFRRRRRRAAGPPDPDPVVLVSGVGGSVLRARIKKTKFEILVWVRIFLANMEFKKYIWSIYNPKTGYTESWNENVEIFVPDDDYGLYAIDVLDPSLFAKVCHLTDVYYFHDMIEMLVGCGYKKGTTLFGYGYDFRQSIRIDKLMDGLKEKLVTAYTASGGKKVSLISHSMGGLLIRVFMALYPDLVECPSIYEMLPNPEFKWKQPPLIRVWRKQIDGQDDLPVKLETYAPTESTTLFEESLRNNKLEYGKKSVALPFNLSIHSWAAKTRQILDEAQIPDTVSFYNIYGISNDTPYDVCYGSETSPICDLSEVCHTVPEYSYVDGDGTVPSESAKVIPNNATIYILEQFFDIIHPSLQMGEPNYGDISLLGIEVSDIIIVPAQLILA